MVAKSPVRNYLKNVWDSVYTTLVGMRITGKYLLQKPITVQYPDERLPIPDRYRGIHYLEQEKCINCLACARACPIDCIEMDAIRHGKELEWVSFTLDYQKCMFCELCVYPCPKDCIHMGTEYAFVSFDRSEFKHDLLSYKGMDRAARVRKKEAGRTLDERTYDEMPDFRPHELNISDRDRNQMIAEVSTLTFNG